MTEVLVVLIVFPATLVAAYVAQRCLLTLLFRTMVAPLPSSSDEHLEPGV
jgi:hypothetical protein